MVPFDAVIQSEMGGKRIKFYGNTSLNFNQAYKEVDIDPYFLGYWLGDGNSRNSGITIEDCVISVAMLNVRRSIYSSF